MTNMKKSLVSWQNLGEVLKQFNISESDKAYILKEGLYRWLKFEASEDMVQRVVMQLVFDHSGGRVTITVGHKDEEVCSFMVLKKFGEQCFNTALNMLEGGHTSQRAIYAGAFTNGWHVSDENVRKFMYARNCIGTVVLLPNFKREYFAEIFGNVTLSSRESEIVKIFDINDPTAPFDRIKEIIDGNKVFLSMHLWRLKNVDGIRYLVKLCDEQRVGSPSWYAHREYLKKLAGNKNTPSDVLDIIFEHHRMGSRAVKVSLASHPNATPELLKKMFKKTRVKGIKEKIANNVNCDDDIKTEFATEEILSV